MSLLLGRSGATDHFQRDLGDWSIVLSARTWATEQRRYHWSLLRTASLQKRYGDHLGTSKVVIDLVAAASRLVSGAAQQVIQRAQFDVPALSPLHVSAGSTFACSITLTSAVLAMWLNCGDRSSHWRGYTIRKDHNDASERCLRSVTRGMVFMARRLPMGGPEPSYAFEQW